MIENIQQYNNKLTVTIHNNFTTDTALNSSK